MRLNRTGLAALGAIGGALALATSAGAHKPITSPFTFSEHVRPILETQCGRCHAPGGVAPMSLLTHAETVPWGESMRAELMAGHMPPWEVEGAPGRFQNAQALTARELDILLTWASGGTPAGDPGAPSVPAAVDPGWPLGRPDLELPLPRTFTLAADVQEETAEFVVPTGLAEPAWVRAVDLRPGTPAIVRRATIQLRDPGTGASADGPAPESVLAVWVPGDVPVALDTTAAFRLPANAELLVRIHYRKTWAHEREEMSDRSTVGIYFAPGPAQELRALRLAPPADATIAEPATSTGSEAGATLTYSHTIDRDLDALAIYPDPALTFGHVAVTAERPGGSREELIAFRPKAEWARRYWFAEPVPLPRGTIVRVVAATAGGLLPPGSLPPPPMSEPAAVRLTVNVVSGGRR